MTDLSSNDDSYRLALPVPDLARAAGGKLLAFIDDYHTLAVLAKIAYTIVAIRLMHDAPSPTPHE